MTSVDTNVLIRLLTGDDPRQTAVAKSLFATETIWIAKTVLLETAWVLSSRHGFEDDAIAKAFTKLFGRDNVYVEDEGSVTAAISLVAHGIDLADAMHLNSRPPGASFVSFDRAIIRRAKRMGTAGVAEL